MTTENQTELLKTLQETYPDNSITAEDVNNVDPVLGREFFKKCIVAVIFASVIMVVYIGFRFRKIGGASAGIVAVIALLHDILISFGIFVLLGFPINDNFIAVVLTILGYSINASIIVFDRVRENLRTARREDFASVAERSVWQTMGRTINTTLTTLFTIGMVFILGVPSLKQFTLPLIVGILAGGWSSVLLSCSLWNVFRKKFRKKRI